MTNRSPQLGLHRAQVLIAATLFSTGGAAIKATAWSSWQVAGLRSGLAALALALLMPSWRRNWNRGTLAVGLAYGLTMMLYVLANKLTTAANTIFLQSTAPMYLLLLGPHILGERVRRSDWALTATLALGMLLFFVGAEPPSVTAPQPWRGNILAAMAGLTWALTILGLRWLGRGVAEGREDTTGGAVIVGNSIAALICIPMAIPLATSGPVDWLIVGYLGLFQIGLAYVFLTYGVRRLRALETALLLLLEPVLNALWAWLVHAEQPGPWSLTGGAIILVATVLRVFRGS